jgi:hypothetical protein
MPYGDTGREPVEQQLHAHEAHASALAAALLLLLWGAVSLFIVPARFRIIDSIDAAVGAIALAWLLTRRDRPDPARTYAFIAVAIASTLVWLPWIAIEWCAVGRPFEAFTIPQVAIITVALVVPRSLVLGIVTMLLFVAEALFTVAYADHVGLHDRLPVGEPFITLYFTLPGVGLLLLRERRRRLARRHVRLRAEAEALARLSPLFADVHRELTSLLAVVSDDLRAIGASSAMAATARSVDRLAAIGAQIGGLAEATPPPPADAAAANAPATECERVFLAGDEQFGAAVFAVVTILLALGWAPLMRAQIGDPFALSVLMSIGAAGTVLALLYATRSRPTQRRGRAALLALFAVVLLAVSLHPRAFIVAGRPFNPFIGQKILMVTLGVTAAGWSSWALPLIVGTAVEALALYFALGFDALKDRISVVEPWVTLVFMATGIAALMLRDQRRVASVALLRAEAEAMAWHRRAVILLALRDQLNTPLQTLVLGAKRLELGTPARDLPRLRASIDRLVALSRSLAHLEIPGAAPPASMGRDALPHAPQPAQ